MIKKYKITGLECPNCARNLENQLNKLARVKTAKIDFMRSILELECDEEAKALKDVLRLTKKIEPNVTICINQQKTRNKSAGVSFVFLITGVLIGILIFTIEMAPVLYWVLFVVSALLMGYQTYYRAFNLLLKGTINENFLVTLSVVGATLVGEHFDGLMVIALYSVGKILESVALNKSKKTIEALTNIKPEFAVILNHQNQEIKVAPSEIKVGDVLVVRAGEKVAVDGVVDAGNVSLNTQSLTGESLPQVVKQGDEVLSGSIVLDGVLYVKASEEYQKSTVNKIIDLIENASSKKAKTETVIAKISRWYSLGVIALSILVWGIVWAVSKDFNVAIYRGLIFLVVSCPCAFAISVPLAYFSGLGNASKNGILIKGSNYLDVLANIGVVAFDKTGTLTTGKFEITEVVIKNEKYGRNDILYLASLGEQYSNHPLAKAIVDACNKKLMKLDVVREIAGKGVKFEFEGHTYFVGRKNLQQENTVVELYQENTLIGEIYLQDALKPSSQVTIQQLKKLGIKTVMLSGDNDVIVKRVANELQIQDAYAKLLPENKFRWIEKKKAEGVNIAYVGDGINDAPSLTLADVGVSMGLNGSAVSLEASDVVIANDNPEKIIDGIKIAKYTRKIVWQNIIISALIKITFLTLGALGITGMLSAVIADVGVTVLAILNSLRALKYQTKKS
ncbi:MAG: cadmium-translocating P-type ATPase [Clostridia bacterium]|nr:cadmium-translocating P-type ATPase [Clostridia bacterium]